MLGTTSSRKCYWKFIDRGPVDQVLVAVDQVLLPVDHVMTHRLMNASTTDEDSCWNWINSLAILLTNLPVGEQLFLYFKYQ